eukprot:UN02256
MSSRSDKGTVAKILVIGDVATGKTSMIQRYVYKTFDPNHNATLGVDFALKRVRVEDSLLNVQLWDIAGQERFIGLAPTYYKHAVAAIVVFDITKRDTLENAKKWKADVDDKVFLRNGDNIPVVLFANKWDLVDENDQNRTVSDDELDDFCHENHYVGWFTTSAKTGLNVKKGMNFIITKVMKNNRKLEQENVEPEDTSKNIDFNNMNKKQQQSDGGGCSCQL